MPLAADEMPTVACLCAAWCTTCQAYAATFAQVARTHPGARFVWIDIEDHSDALGDEALDIENFPTLMLLRGDTPLFFGTVLPHAATLSRLVHAAEDGSLASTDHTAARHQAEVLARPVAELARTLPGVR